MEPGFFIFLFVAAVVAVPIAIYTVRQNLRNLLDACDRAAAKLGGRRVGGGVISAPEIRFSLDGCPAVLRFPGRASSNSPCTRVEVSLKARGWFKIASRTFSDGLFKLFGARDIEVGVPDFDARYMIEASSESLIRSIFRPDRRERAVEAVRRLERHPGPRVELRESTLEVEVVANLREADELLRLARTAREFAEWIVGARPEAGIVWVKGVDGPGACPVCASALAEGVVRCMGCATPHHRECWDYAGECSTFACGGRRAA